MAATGKRHFPHTTPDTAADAVYQEITAGAAHVKPLGAGGGPLGYAQMTSITTATALTGIPATATVVVIQAEAQNLRFRDDGVSPTGSVGYLIQTGAGGEMIYTGDLSTVELIEDTSGAIANLLYY